MANLVGVIQFGIGGVFLISSIGKLKDPRHFRRGVAEYGVLPAFLVTTTAFVIVLVESLLAISHLTGTFLRILLPFGIAMLSSFGVAVAVNLWRGRVFPCHCFGRADAISVGTLARLALLACGETLLLIARRPMYFKEIDRSEVGFVIFWMSIVLVLDFWSVSLSDLLRLLRPTGRLTELQIEQPRPS